ncbi:UNVERIFIED_CONTAM: hypothetical protein K2H54_027416 [Gekko kuhli]
MKYLNKFPRNDAYADEIQQKLEESPPQCLLPDGLCCLRAPSSHLPLTAGWPLPSGLFAEQWARSERKRRLPAFTSSFLNFWRYTWGRGEGAATWKYPEKSNLATVISQQQNRISTASGDYWYTEEVVRRTYYRHMRARGDFPRISPVSPTPIIASTKATPPHTHYNEKHAILWRVGGEIYILVSLQVLINV